MSGAHFEQLQATGRLPATTETFVSPSVDYVLGRYQGRTVAFEVEAGTRDALAVIGVRDRSAELTAEFPDMPTASKGWTTTSAFFKQEGRNTNIGLGIGPGLDIFNDRIVEFREVDR